MYKNIRKTKSSHPTSNLKGRNTRERTVGNETVEPRPTVQAPRSSSKTDRFVRNRCCLVRPKQRDFCQITEADQFVDLSSHKKYLSLLTESCGCETEEVQSLYGQIPYAPFGENVAKTENYSQYSSQYIRRVPIPMLIETSDGTQWENVESINDIQQSIATKDSSNQCSEVSNIYISDMPKLKVIADKFFKYQNNTMELRCLDEKLVCLEYDIYDQSSLSQSRLPVQTMRAFFAIKPTYKDGLEPPSVTELPSNIKLKLNIDEDIRKLTKPEIEIIDDKIMENKSYLDDLKRILKRIRHRHEKNEESTLDLKSLYKLAKRQWHTGVDYSVGNFFTEKELVNLKDMILKRCASSVHGINRNRLKNISSKTGILSGIIAADLFRKDRKRNCA